MGGERNRGGYQRGEGRVGARRASHILANTRGRPESLRSAPGRTHPRGPASTCRAARTDLRGSFASTLRLLGALGEPVAAGPTVAAPPSWLGSGALSLGRR